MNIVVHTNKKSNKILHSPKSFLKNYVFENPICEKKRKKKVSDNEFEILEYHEYNQLLVRNYNVSQLKQMLRFYKQRLSGNKSEKIYLLYNYLKYSSYAIKIQKCYRGYLRRYFNSLRGERNHKNFVNDTDFFLLEEFSDMDPKQIYSYRDDDNFIYGFDICSLWNLLKQDKKATNPYNRKLLPKNTVNNIKKIVKIGSIFKEAPNIKIEQNNNNLSNAKKRELRAISLFQKMDEHGFITNANWYLNLNRHGLKSFLRELLDIWEYRAQLNNESKRNINPQHGNPFFSINIPVLLSKCFEVLQNRILDIIEIFITKGNDIQARALGVFFVLGALTTVSHDASTSLPWLYDSFVNTQQ